MVQTTDDINNPSVNPTPAPDKQPDKVVTPDEAKPENQ